MTDKERTLEFLSSLGIEWNMMDNWVRLEKGCKNVDGYYSSFAAFAFNEDESFNVLLVGED